MPKVYIKTFGCQMNKRDSDVLMGNLLSLGFEQAIGFDDADVVIVNTCAVRRHAEDRVFSLLGAIGKRKEQQKRPRILMVMGCMAEEWKDGLLKRAPYVDIVCGANSVYEAVNALSAFLDGSIQPSHAVFCNADERPEAFYKNGAWFSSEEGHSFVNIMEGCNNFCSYCVVPFVRGRERSRQYVDVLDEVKSLVDMGISRFTLLGQNVNSYNGGIDFPSLLEQVANIKGVSSLAFATSHPKDASKRLFEVMAGHKNIVKYLHLPLQSGSDRILRLMNRGYTLDKYLGLVELYRNTVSGGQLGTDIIVGFPGETDEDYMCTFNALKAIEFDVAYIFKYSPRQGTAAARLDDDVPAQVKADRHRLLLDLQIEISNRRRKKE